MTRRELLTRAAMIGGLAATQPWELLRTLGISDLTGPAAEAAIAKKTLLHGFNYLQASMPDFQAKYGIMPCVNVTHANYAGWNDLTALPPDSWFDLLAASYTNANNYLCLDIEGWAVDTQAHRLTTSDMFVTTYNKVKARRPELKIGFYTVPFVRNFNGATADHASQTFLDWQASNDDFATMWAVIDYCAPSIYWFYTVADDGANADQNNQLYYDQSIIEVKRNRTAHGEGRTIPICPFVFPKRLQGDHFISQGAWDAMVRTAFVSADGFFLWMDLNTPTPWDETAWWWVNFKAAYPFGDRGLRQPRTQAQPR